MISRRNFSKTMQILPDFWHLVEGIKNFDKNPKKTALSMPTTWGGYKIFWKFARFFGNWLVKAEKHFCHLRRKTHNWLVETKKMLEILEFFQQLISEGVKIISLKSKKISQLISGGQKIFWKFSKIFPNWLVRSKNSFPKLCIFFSDFDVR